MKTITPQLPTILGSCAAMLIAFLSLMNGTSSETCLMKALAAFLVFAGFGLLLRFALSDTLAEADETEAHLPSSGTRAPSGQLDMILPGTSVADLLGMQSSQSDDINSDSAAA